jgi:hypothetical protein
MRCLAANGSIHESYGRACVCVMLKVLQNCLLLVEVASQTLSQS